MNEEDEKMLLTAFYIIVDAWDQNKNNKAWTDRALEWFEQFAKVRNYD